jgi:magnesium chelatase accessory protein
MPLLAERFTVLAPDLPGHGFTTTPPRFQPTLPAMAAALVELLEALEVSPVAVVGHSAGAAVAARLALDGSIEPRALVGLGAAMVPFRGLAGVLFLPAARLLARSPLASRVLAAQARDQESVARMLRSTGSALDARGVELYRQLSTRPEHVAAVLSMMASWDLAPLFAELPALETPFLLVAGQGDRAVPVAQQREAAARLPSGRLVVVRGAGHLVHEEQPERVARLILGALARSPRTRVGARR